jgi:ABC-type nitrate/sulfonate/bicarbonate transport system substrate-binding protein
VLKTTTWRSRTAAAASLVAVLAAGACSSSGGGSKAGGGTGTTGSNGLSGQRFTLMLQSTPNVSKVVEVHAVNLLSTQGVKTSIKWNASTPNVAISQLTSGNLDAYSEAVTGGVGAIAAGVPLVDFALAQPRQDYVLLGRPGITSLSQLKGKKIGVQDTTGVNFAQARLALKAAGLNPNDVSIIAVGGQSTRLPALVAGRVDATMLSHTAQLKLGPQGYTTLYDYTKQASQLYDDNIFSTSSWVKSHHALAVALNKALLESYKWFDNAANDAAIVGEAMKIDPTQDKTQTKKFFDELRAADAYPASTILSPSLLTQQESLYKDAGAIQGTVPVAQWVDDSAAKEALASS